MQKVKNELRLEVNCDTTGIDIALDKVKQLNEELNICLNLIKEISIPPVEINEKRSGTREPARV